MLFCPSPMAFQKSSGERDAKLKREKRVETFFKKKNVEGGFEETKKTKKPREREREKV